MDTSNLYYGDIYEVDEITKDSIDGHIINYHLKYLQLGLFKLIAKNDINGEILVDISTNVIYNTKPSNHITYGERHVLSKSLRKYDEITNSQNKKISKRKLLNEFNKNKRIGVIYEKNI